MSSLFKEKKYYVSRETERVVNLPLQYGNPDPVEISALLKSEQGTQTLRAVQAAMVYQFMLGIRHYRGVFAPVAVGEGKTLPSLLAASIALSAVSLGIRRVMLFTKPDIKAQTMRDISFYGPHWAWREDVCTVPFYSRTPLQPTPQFGTWHNPNTNLWYNFHDGKAIHIFLHGQWVAYNSKTHVAPDGTEYRVGFPRGTRFSVHTYNELSLSDRRTGQPKLDLMIEQPGLLILDEVHSLKLKNATRTMRVNNYMEAFPNTVVFAMSGTLTTRSIYDYAHIIKWCLKDMAPLPFVHDDKWMFGGKPYTKDGSGPFTHEDLQAWAAVLDSDKKSPPTSREFALLEPLRDRFAVEDDYKRANTTAADYESGTAEIEAKIAVMRHSYRHRLVMTPGVVATSESSLQIPLIMEKIRVTAPREVEDALNFLDQKWETLDQEDIISDAMIMAAHKRHVGAGFWYKRIWKDGIKDQQWIDDRKLWHSLAREELIKGLRGADSLMLLALACRRVLGLTTDKASDINDYNGEYDEESDAAEDLNSLQVKAATSTYVPPDELVEAYKAWNKVRDRYKPAPPTQAIWVSNFLVGRIQELLDNELKDRPTVIWYQTRAMAEALKTLKIWNGSKRESIKVYGQGTHKAVNALIASRKAVTCAMSVKCHGTGKNLQMYNCGIDAEPIGNGTIKEQQMGRFHRMGQEADEVRWFYFTHCEPYVAAMEQAKRDAAYQEATMGPQKLTKVIWVE